MKPLQLDIAAISRSTLALFAGGSNDHNPIHLDVDVARAGGHDEVFAQGMLTMAYLGRMMTDSVPQDAIQTFSVRFVDIVHVGDELSCSGTSTTPEAGDPPGSARLRLQVMAGGDRTVLAGHALVHPDN